MDSSSTPVGGSPLLSLIVGGRNDAYMGDFQWRFATTLNFLGKSLAAVGRLKDLEVVVCDWGSDVPLHTMLTLCPEACEIVRFLVVPPDIARSASAGSDFPIPIVQNVAIRRSWGRFIGQTDSDVLYTPATVLALLTALEGKLPGVPVNAAFLTAGRRHLPIGQVLRQPSLLELQEYLNRNAGLFPPEAQQAGSAAPTALVIMHRDLWSRLQGYDERWVHWGWMDLDLALRATQEYPILALNNFGVNLVHIEHYVNRDYDPKKHFRKTNRPDDTPRLIANDVNWGLADEDFAWHRVQKVKEPPAPTATTPGEVQAWPISPDTLIGEMSHSKWVDAAQAAVRTFPIALDAAESHLLVALAWYASKRSPQTYVETGMRLAYAASLVAMHAPGVEVNIAVDWQRPREDEKLFVNRDDACLTFYAANVLRDVGRHWAYSRFVGGDAATAVTRLRESYPGQLRVDLALIRGGLNGPAQAVEVGRLLRPGGMIAFVAPDAAAFQAIDAALKADFPRFTYLHFNEGRSGMAIAATLAPS